jgi:hypothetical protein
MKKICRHEKYWNVYEKKSVYVVYSGYVVRNQKSLISVLCTVRIKNCTILNYTEKHYLRNVHCFV